jgi:hypothetical protein
VRTTGTCAVSGVFKYTAAHTGTDIPASVVASTSCYPAGAHCTQEAHTAADVRQVGQDERHIGTANSDCSGTSGMCSTVASAAFDPATGRVQAFADCDSDGAATCTRSATHTEAWAQSPDGELAGKGRSDCARTGGLCSSVSIAKYYPATTRTVEGKQVPVPAHVESGAGCEAGGALGACSFSYSATGHAGATGDDGRLESDAKGTCADSGTAGSGYCSVAAQATVTDTDDNHSASAVGWCQSSNAASCSFAAHAKATADSDKNNAASEKSCGQGKAGMCSLSVAAMTAGGDDEHQGAASAAGYCDDGGAGTCKGTFSTHVDSNRDTLSDCSSAGNGFCSGEAAPDHAKSWGESDQALELHSKAPGEEFRKTCAPGGDCGTENIKDADGKGQDYTALNANTHKSVGGFFKNLGRDGGGVLVHAVPGLVGGIGKEFWSWGKELV